MQKERNLEDMKVTDIRHVFK